MFKRVKIILLISVTLFGFYCFVVFIHDATLKSSRESISNFNLFLATFFFNKGNKFEFGDLIDFQLGNLIKNHSKVKFARKKLAVIVPYRDRFEELLLFVPHLKKFLVAKKIPHHIFAINQVDQFRFNRGALINVGFQYQRGKFDYIAIHDIDALPLSKQLPYDCPKHGVTHLLVTTNSLNDYVRFI